MVYSCNTNLFKNIFLDLGYNNRTLMVTLHVVNELYTNGFKADLLNIISFLAILSGIFILTSKNPIVSVLFLISLFGSISVYLIMLGLSFIGLSYLIVYIGAVSILFLFILMLINIRISELQNNTVNSIPLAILIIISLTYTIFQILPYDIVRLNSYNFIGKTFFYLLSPENKTIDTNNNDLSFVTSNSWDTSLIEVNHISSIGNILYTTHNIWLILTSLILLLAMVGAIVVTVKSNKTLRS